MTETFGFAGPWITLGTIYWSVGLAILVTILTCLIRIVKCNIRMGTVRSYSSSPRSSSSLPLTYGKLIFAESARRNSNKSSMLKMRLVSPWKRKTDYRTLKQSVAKPTTSSLGEKAGE